MSVDSSMLLTLASKRSVGPRLAEGHLLVLDPIAFAGWLGLMITALNFFVAARASIPPVDAVTPLGPARQALGWAAFGLLLTIVLPVPHAVSSALGLQCPYV